MKYAGDFGIGHTGEGFRQVRRGPNQDRENLGHEEANPGKPTSGLWPAIIFAGALACVALAAVLAPYEQTALSRLSGVETPYLKVQFAIPPSLADKAQVLNVERDLNFLDTLEEFSGSFRFIQYDCAQAALDAGVGVTEFTRDQSRKYQEFTLGLAFELRLLPYVNQLVNAKRTGYNRVVLNARARQVAEKFAPLATKENYGRNDRAAMFKFEENYRSAMSEVERQWELFDEEGVKADLTAKEDFRRRNDRDPEYCWPSKDDITLASDVRNIWMVIQKRPRPILELTAALFHFVGDTSAANAIRIDTLKLNPTTDDINTFGAHAGAQYIEGNDLREVIRLRQNDLQVVELRLGTAERAKVWSDEEVKKVSTRETDNNARNDLVIDNKAHNDLVRRYTRARFMDRLRLAYLWA